MGQRIFCFFLEDVQFQISFLVLNKSSEKKKGSVSFLGTLLRSNHLSLHRTFATSVPRRPQKIQENMYPNFSPTCYPQYCHSHNGFPQFRSAQAPNPAQTWRRSSTFSLLAWTLFEDQKANKTKPCSTDQSSWYLTVAFPLDLLKPLSHNQSSWNKVGRSGLHKSCRKMSFLEVDWHWKCKFELCCTWQRCDLKQFPCYLEYNTLRETPVDVFTCGKSQWGKGTRRLPSWIWLGKGLKLPATSSYPCGAICWVEQLHRCSHPQIFPINPAQAMWLNTMKHRSKK